MQTIGIEVSLVLSMFIAVFTGVLMQNRRIDDMKEVLKELFTARMDALDTKLTAEIRRLEEKVDARIIQAR